MTIELRDPEAITLAKQLAERRNVTTGEVLRDALRHEWQREKDMTIMREKVAALQAEVRAMSDPSKILPVDKAFIDSLYEDD